MGFQTQVSYLNGHCQVTHYPIDPSSPTEALRNRLRGEGEAQNKTHAPTESHHSESTGRDVTERVQHGETETLVG